MARLAVPVLRTGAAWLRQLGLEATVVKLRRKTAAEAALNASADDDGALIEEGLRLCPRVDGIVLVSNEVGMGLVPETPLGRSFRDAAGWLNQDIAAVADRVVFVAAGLPLVLKDN